MTTTYTKTELDNVTVGFGIAAVTTILFNTVLTIWKESYPPLLAYMKTTSILGVKHHWLFHGLTLVILFLVLGWAFSRKKEAIFSSNMSLAKAIVWATILGSLAIFFFYLKEMMQ